VFVKLKSLCNADHTENMNDVSAENMAEALRSGQTYLTHDAEWWAKELRFAATPQRIEELTGIAIDAVDAANNDEGEDKDEDDEFAQSMLRLAAFRIDGSHYDPSWEDDFPLFDGEAPVGHLHPRAYAVNFAQAQRQPTRETQRRTLQSAEKQTSAPKKTPKLTLRV
jgi:hypothetical protein